jgi:hypothetical protein
MTETDSRPVFCILSTSMVSPDEAKKLWKDSCGICMKPSYRHRGIMYNVFFPDIPALRKDGGGYDVTWSKLRNKVDFVEVEGGLLRGYYVG